MRSSYRKQTTPFNNATFWGKNQLAHRKIFRKKQTMQVSVGKYNHLLFVDTRSRTTSVEAYSVEEINNHRWLSAILRG